MTKVLFGKLMYEWDELPLNTRLEKILMANGDLELAKKRHEVIIDQEAQLRSSENGDKFISRLEANRRNKES